MSVKLVMVREAGGFISLRDMEPPSNLQDVEIVLVGRFLCKKFLLPTDVKKAILSFLQSYHAKQDIEFDCYAFANMVKGGEVHKVPLMLKHWDTNPLPWRIPIGSVVFFQSSVHRFHHAAIYIGSGLYISVWGAGGDLEVATLKSMKRDYVAEKVLLAKLK